MADAEVCTTRNLKKNVIMVTVEEALDDLLVVSYSFDSRSFQGVLLDSTKRSWPLGIVAPLAFPGTADVSAQPPSAQTEDKLFAVSRRYTYFQGEGEQQQPPGGATGNRNGTLLPRRNYCKRLAERGGRTMRLRPRQVLCSKCKSICNENSENVEMSAGVTKRDPAASTDVPETRTTLSWTNSSSNVNCGSSSNGTGAVHDPSAIESSSTSGLGAGGDRMVLRRRRPAEDVAAMAPCPPPPPLSLPPPMPPLPATAPKRSRENDFDALLAAGAEDEPGPTETQQPLPEQQQLGVTAKTSPFIKISFGPQGTVLKIPPRSHNYSASEHDSAELQEVITPLIDSATLAIREANAKAARKALKRAKKEAQRVGGLATGQGSAPGSPSAGEACRPRHHRHKFKHKRRHSRGEGPGEPHPLALGEHNGVSPGRLQPPLHHRRDAGSSENASPDHWDRSDGARRSTDAYSDIKRECLRQKLSISLKRLSEKAYRCGSPSEVPPLGEAGDSDGGNGVADVDEGAGSDTDGEEAGGSDGVPAFPQGSDDPPPPTPPLAPERVVGGAAARPLTMRISSHRVAATRLSEGATLAVADVVWGKIHGFPWWPGRVLSITVSQRDNGMLVTQQAHVAWFGSSTSSCVPCQQLVPFLECFNTRYNKRKRGPYKEAVKQATLAAQQALGPAIRAVNTET